MLIQKWCFFKWKRSVALSNFFSFFDSNNYLPFTIIKDIEWNIDTDIPDVEKRFIEIIIIMNKYWSKNDVFFFFIETFSCLIKISFWIRITIHYLLTVKIYSELLCNLELWYFSRLVLVVLPEFNILLVIIIFFFSKIFFLTALERGPRVNRLLPLPLRPSGEHNVKEAWHIIRRIGIPRVARAYGDSGEISA